MRTPLVWLPLVAMTLSSLPCQARLGETINQCVERFGSPDQDTGVDPKSSRDRIIMFKYEGYGVTITFRNNLAVDETFLRLDKKSLTQKEIKMLLDADTENLAWNEFKPGMYKRTDGAFALTIDHNNLLTISSKESQPKGF